MDVHASISEALRAGRSTLDEESGKRVLAANGIKVPASLLIAEPDGASGAFTKLSPPLVAKIVSPDIVHKSDIGGVRVRIGSAEELETALREIESAARAHTDDIEGYLVEEMAPAGHEVVVGGSTDQTFGPIVMFGLGGIFVEVLADVAFRICPITPVDAREMIDELKAVKLLRGARGGIHASEEAIVDTLLKVGGEDGMMLALEGKVTEIDINPLIVSESEAIAVDARFVLKRD
jgi:acetyl-CoA synthetase (ADP-forming)